MKCRTCGQVAVINMRHHKLALCGEHYLEWLPAQVQRFVEKQKLFTPHDRLLVAVSGGKDSLSLWDILLRLGYQADGLYIGLGIDEGIAYSEESHQKTVQFIEQFHPDASLHVVDVEQTYGMTIPELSRARRRHDKPCSVCGLNKRHIMNRVAVEEGYVLVTGHNLDDEAAVLMQNMLRWQTGYLARQSPLLESTHPKFARKVKPLARVYEREMAAYALVRGIDYIYEECPFSVGATTLFHKTLLNQLEAHSPGAKLAFYLEFLRARQEGLFKEVQAGVQLHECDYCGQPTTAPGLCSFCRMWERGTPDITHSLSPDPDLQFAHFESAGASDI
ncbi:MAG: adenine nucleotide alpha hydrolase family protein [Chloroflexi bacterium]|nr:MAG: adenine nucleotide alpha hydrolase family protein [Chloroflexota bacterium]